MSTVETLFGRDADILEDTNFQLLLLANVMGAPLGTALISPLLDSLAGVFGVSETQIGLMVTAFTAPSIVLIPIVGVLTDRVGRKPILIVGLLVFGLAGSAIALTTDFQVVLLLRFLQGVGFAGLTPVIITSIGDLYDKSTEATAQGLRFSTSGLSQTVFPLLAGVLVAFAWQYPLLLFLAAVPVALFVNLWFDEPAAIETNGLGHDERGHVRDVIRLAARPPVLATITARAVPPFLYIGFLTFNSFIVVRLAGETPTEAGILVAACTLVYAAAASQVGRITNLFDSRRNSLIVSHLCICVGVSVVAFAPRFALLIPGAAAIGVGLGITLSMYRSIITGFAPTALRGGLVSVTESAGRLAATLAPLVMGLTVDLLTPTMRFGPAVRWTLFGFATVTTLVAIGCLAVAARSAEVEPAEPTRA